MLVTLRARWRAAPRPHRVMLLAAPALMLAWLLVRGEHAKQGVLLLGLLLLLVTATTAVRAGAWTGDDVVGSLDCRTGATVSR